MQLARVLSRLFLLWALLGASGCGIGTWPQPEGEGNQSAGGVTDEFEECQGLDDDADGLVDEGCPCSGAETRSCVAAVAGECRRGLQRCVSNTFSDQCTDLGARDGSANAVDLPEPLITPSIVARQAGTVTRIEVTPVPACGGMRVSSVIVTVAASDPTMSFKLQARDDGAAPDLTAGDGVFVAELPALFGDSVPAQSLNVVVEALLGGKRVRRVVSIELAEVAP